VSGVCACLRAECTRICVLGGSRVCCVSGVCTCLCAECTRVCVLGVSPNDRDTIHKVLLAAKDTVDVTVFSTIKETAVDRLCDIWVAYLKDDIEQFLEYD
jgi:hypothetical protein